MDKKILEYIEKQKSPLKEIILRIRDIFYDTIPDCREKSKWGVITFADDKFYLGVVNDRIHVGFSVNGLSHDEIQILDGSGKTMRHIKIRSLEEIDEEKLKDLIKLVLAKAVCKPCGKDKK